MYIAIDDNNHKVNVDSATKEGLYYCPICKSKLIVKDGECRTKHFAHKINQCLDNWHYDMSEWHRSKQELFPVENREVVVSGNKQIHRADILIKNTVIEFQHSPITASEFLERTNFFMSLGYRITWVFDISEQYFSERITLSENKDYMYEWKHPMSIFALLPSISDYNTKFSLWFSFIDDYNEKEVFHKIIWAPKNENDVYNLERFIISPYVITPNKPIDIDEFFATKEDWFKIIVENELKGKLSYSIKRMGEGGYPRNDYVCPKRKNDFGIRLYSEIGCLYCSSCYMIAHKNKYGKNIYNVYCCYPSKVRKICEPHPGYECSSARIYES